jgi:ABC-type multidrug transport system ATPase subunit
VSIALNLKGVTKAYGKRLAMNDLTCHVPTGSICGFVGPNGAGKTTAFSVVSGFVQPNSGEVDILGLGPFDPYAMKGQLGVLPQDAALPDRHTPTELLVHLARLQGLSAKNARSETARLLDLVRLDDRKDARIASLSHGMRRRVAVASALVGSPRLVLLDEPLAGLDPTQQRSLREALSALRGIQTLVVSSHNLLELERLCDWVVMLDEGKLVDQGTLEELTGEGTRVTWELGAGDVPLDTLAERLPDDRFELANRTLTQVGAGDLDQTSVVVMAALAEAGVGVRAVRRGMGLEKRFIDATE